VPAFFVVADAAKTKIASWTRREHEEIEEEVTV
jgi:hypothetical protein